VIAQLGALGAPLSLLASTSRALSDEVEHARLAFELCAKLGFEAPLGSFADAVAPLAPQGASLSDVRRELLVDTVIGGCLGETRSAVHALERAAETTGDVRSFFERIAKDEARHAALAFETLAWLAGPNEELWTLVETLIAEEAAADPDAARGVVRPIVAELRRSHTGCMQARTA
jgi:rubrerythrin